MVFYRMDSFLTESQNQYPNYKISHSPHTNGGVKIVKINDSYQPTPHLHQHNFWELCFFFDGFGKHIIDFCSYDIQPQSLMIIKPQQIHHIQKSTHLSGYFVMFEKQILNQFMTSANALTLSNNLPLKPMPISKSLDITLSTLLHFFYQKKSYSHQQVYTSLKLLILEIENHFSISKQRFFPTIITTFFYYLNDSIRCFHSVKTIAKQCGVSPNYLNECLKKHTQKNAKSWIFDALLINSQRELATTDKSISKIAFDLGFYDSANFCRFFKSRTNCSPLNWRKQFSLL